MKKILVKKTLAAFTCAALVSTQFASLSYAQPHEPALDAGPQGGPEGDGPGRGPGGKGHFIMEIFRSLNLSPEQKQKLKELHKNQKSMRENMPQMREEHEKLSALLKNPNSSDQEILAQAKKMNSFFEEHNEQRIKKLLEVRKILSKEQFQELVTKLGEHREKRREEMRQRFGMEGGADHPMMQRWMERRRAEGRGDDDRRGPPPPGRPSEDREFHDHRGPPPPPDGRGGPEGRGEDDMFDLF